MPEFRVNVKIEQKGAVFDAAGTKAKAARTVVAINDAIATEGVSLVRARLDRSLQNPTGYYRSRVIVDRRKTYRGITDQGVIYGGWLEGVTTRNKTSRFKGYHTFRQVKQELVQRRVAIAAPLVAQFVNDMNK